MAGLSKNQVTFSSGSGKVFSFEVSGSGISQNTWYDTGYSKGGLYQHAGAMILINFSNQDGDAGNLSGIARAPSGTAYLNGVNNTTWTSISGSTGVEAKWSRVGSTNEFRIQVRTTSSSAGGTYEVLHGLIFISDY